MDTYTKKEMTSLDLFYLLPELRSVLVGGVFRKIYNYGKKEYRFEIFTAGKGTFWLYTAPGIMYLTKTKRESPPEPSSFCMFLRKHLLGRKVMDIVQHDFDRLIEVKTDGSTIIIELMRPGNIILVDGTMTVIMQEEIQIHKDRTIKPKQPYKYPPKPINPFTLETIRFASLVRDSDKKLGVFMAHMVGPGYSNEVCKRAGLDSDQETSSLNQNNIIDLFNEMHGIVKEKPSPTVYENTVSPFQLKDQEGEKYPNFSEALDAFFTPSILEQDEEEEKETRIEEEKVERMQEAQEERKEELEVQKVVKREEADLIYSHYGTVSSVIEALNRAKEGGMSWAELKSRIESENTSEADAIEEIREHEGIVVLNLGGKKVEIDFTKTVEQNAESYYEGMKKAKKKLVGVEEAIKQTEEKKEIIRQNVEKPERKQLLPTPKRRKKWYEKFHWFNTSDGYLVIGGKDAKQNDMIFHKRMDSEDYVFHADIQGASLVVAKGQDGNKPSETAIKEASEFSAAHSKAWSKNLTEVDVYCVGPSQVSKTDPSGINVPQGSFVITGQRLWFHKVELKLAIGVVINDYKGNLSGEVVAGSVMSMRKHALAFVTIRPGFKKAPELAKEIKTSLMLKVKPEEKSYIEAIPTNEFETLIPAGQGEIIDFG